MKPTARKTWHPSARGGFTLLELIVAMGMVVILAASLYVSMRVALKTTAGAEAAIEPSRNVEAAMEIIRQDIQNALPPKPVSNNPQMLQQFEGTDGRDDRGHDGDDLVLYTTADAPDDVDGNCDAKRVEMAIGIPAGSTDHALIRYVTRSLTSENPPAPAQEIVLRGIEGFNVQYYDGSEWLDAWDSTQEGDTLPTAVQVTLEMDRPNAPPGSPTVNWVGVFQPSCISTQQNTATATGG